jgi:hypothetical protein
MWGADASRDHPPRSAEPAPHASVPSHRSSAGNQSTSACPCRTCVSRSAGYLGLLTDSRCRGPWMSDPVPAPPLPEAPSTQPSPVCASRRPSPPRMLTARDVTRLTVLDDSYAAHEGPRTPLKYTLRPSYPRKCVDASLSLQCTTVRPNRSAEGFGKGLRRRGVTQPWDDPFGQTQI